MSNSLPVTIEFSGGAELLFGNKKKMTVDLASIDSKTISGDSNDSKWTICKLIEYLKGHHLKERPELFVQGKTVRPGILVLINDTDWELCGELDYEIQVNDNILFISTLHGGWNFIEEINWFHHHIWFMRTTRDVKSSLSLLCHPWVQWLVCNRSR